jgi:hypothetical protein
MDDRVEGQCTRQRDEIPERSAATRIGYLQDGLFGWSVRWSRRVSACCARPVARRRARRPHRGWRGVSTPSRAELDAARLLLQRMGISPADLLKAPAPRRLVPTPRRQCSVPVAHTWGGDVTSPPQVCYGMRSAPDADAVEMALLRHQSAVLRRQVARPRYIPARSDVAGRVRSRSCGDARLPIPRCSRYFMMNMTIWPI